MEEKCLLAVSGKACVHVCDFGSYLVPQFLLLWRCFLEATVLFFFFNEGYRERSACHYNRGTPLLPINVHTLCRWEALFF